MFLDHKLMEKSLSGEILHEQKGIIEQHFIK